MPAAASNSSQTMQDEPTTSPPATAIAEVFHLYDPPLWLVTSVDNGRRGGLIATSVARASIVADLPRMSVGIARQHRTWGLIEGSGRFALHLLAADDLEAVWRFGLASGHNQDKFADFSTETTPDGNPLYSGCRAWLDCRVEDRLDTGDRTLYLVQVTVGEVRSPGPVLSVAALLREAPPERRSELDRLYMADQAIDAAAIRAWRRAKGIMP
jgi:flavin reductase (DIM6/NTAB) family NADH-FMN oxidoreductase RutF